MQEKSPEETAVRQNRRLSDRLYRKIILPTVLIIAVCGMVVVTHLPALSAKTLSFDDYQYFTDNVLVQNPGWASARRFLTEVLEPSTVEGYYQPLAMISLMFDYALGGRENNLATFHRTSLALHAANTALIIVLLYLLFDQIWVAAAVGLLFGVHPMTVEPVPWVGERKTLLAAFFALWSLVFYVRYAQKNRWGFYLGSFLMYLLALMSKPTSIPLPAVMLLMDYWPLRRLNWRAVLEKLPFFVLGGVSAVVTYISQSRTAVTVLPSRFGLERISLVLCHNIIFYLYKMIWPVNLSSHYPFPSPLNLSQPMVLAGVIGTFILILLLLLSLRRTRAALTGFSVFFVAILPTMQIVGFTNVIASDKFAYLPAVGLLMVLASFLGWLCNIGKGIAKYVIAAVIVILAGAEGTVTHRYLRYWQNSISLYEYMLTLAPKSPELYHNLAIALQSDEKVDKAIRNYRLALQLKPGNIASIYSNLGSALETKGSFDEAVSCYRQALRLRPNYAKAYYNLGHLLQSQNKLDEAGGCYRQAVKFRPEYVKAYYNLGTLLQSQGKLDEAVGCYQRAISIKPDFADAHYNLGLVLASKGKLDEAISHYRKALRIQPNDADAYYNLGHALQLQNKLDEAVKCYRRTISIKPDYASAYNNLGVALHSQNRLGEAVDCFRRAIKIKPDYTEANGNLAKVLSALANDSNSPRSR
jgi:tetratricopeptide (TPR) repeat protein